jgi:curved DNA-binding protein CbpA
MIMNNKASMILIFFFILCLPSTTFAMEKPNVEVNILSPDRVKDYPGVEMNVVANVTNHSNEAIEDMMVYITMADLKKHWTVNLEDYSADQPITIGTLQPNETKKVNLPIRFVYTSSYHLYVTATGTKEPWIYSSSAIPIEIMGNTKINATVVQLVSIGEPVILLGVLVGLIRLRRKKQQDT